MCDFRQPPTGIKFSDGTIEPVIFKGSANYTTYKYEGVPQYDEVTEIGVYRIIATGSGYQFFNGEKWDYNVELLFDPDAPHIGCH